MKSIVYILALSVILASCSRSSDVDKIFGVNLGEENASNVQMVNLGIFDPSLKWLGAGNYTGIDETKIPSSDKLCDGLTVLGVKGTAVCQKISMEPQSSAQILSGNTFYDDLGNKVSGTLVNQGGLWDLGNAFPGAGYYSGLHPNQSLSNAEVCNTKKFLGNSGMAICQIGVATNPVSPSDVVSGKEYWDSSGTKQVGTWDLGSLAIYSMAPRKDIATTIPGVDVTRNIATLSQEVSNANTFIDNHNLIPNPKFDTDGRYSNVSGTDARHYLGTVTGRPILSCGISGTIEQRISDCSTQNGKKAFYDGKNYGQSGEGDWKLVTRTSGGFEVWRDERTKLLWSDRMSTTYNWYRASGYASVESDTKNTGGYDARPGKGTGCSGAACQPNPPMSVCVDAALISTLSDYSPFTTPSGEDARKGNLTYASTPSVIWRLPTIEDWHVANANGIRKVLPNMDFWYWSATSVSNSLTFAWFFYGQNGSTSSMSRNSANSVRCVGR